MSMTVTGYTPSWLSHPSPGSHIFTNQETKSPQSPSKSRSLVKIDEDNITSTRRRKNLAHRGAELFVAVGSKIRWMSLNDVKNTWEDNSNKQAPPSEREQAQAYRVLKTPLYYEITALDVSPSGHFLAISTEHSVHIAVLPDAARLNDTTSGELKLKTYQLGPTTHVIPEAPLAAVLWHPLAASSAATDCLVTVTVEAVVRVWSVNRTNISSFDQPELAIDLRKLADGTSCDEDFSPAGFGASKGFSADAFDMEVAAALFGGQGNELEDPWSAMTLWTTMTNGDTYALSPLIPARWRPTATTIPASTTSTIADLAGLDKSSDQDYRRAVQQRYEWCQALDDEDAEDVLDPTIRLRPSNPSIIPRLQGPFEMNIPELDMDAEVADLLVIPGGPDEEALYSGEDDYDDLSISKALPFSIVCIATTTGKLHILLELDGVSGQWLPKAGRNTFSVPSNDSGELTLLDTISIADIPCSPAFTRLQEPYTFLVTTSDSVVSISLEEWASRVASETNGPDADGDVDSGLLGRLRLACQGRIADKQDIIIPPSQSDDSGGASSISTALCIRDSALGTLILSATDSRCTAAQIELSNASFRSSRTQIDFQSSIMSNSFQSSLRTPQPFRQSQSLMQILSPSDHVPAPPTRAPYAPARVLYQDQSHPVTQVKASIPSARRSILKEEPLRLSPKVLEIMTSAHRTISGQTSQIEKAAAELFRRVERLREEMGEQVRQMTELAERLNQVLEGSGKNIEGEEAEGRNLEEKTQARLKAAQHKQKELFARYEAVRRKAGKVGYAKKPISIKERSWIKEVESLSTTFGVSLDMNEQDERFKDEHPNGDGETRTSPQSDLQSRLANAKSITADLLEQAKQYDAARNVSQTATRPESSMSNTTTASTKTRVSMKDLPSRSRGPSKLQQQKVGEVMEMLERETAIIEAVQGRLQRLDVG